MVAARRAAIAFQFPTARGAVTPQPTAVLGGAVSANMQVDDLITLVRGKLAGIVGFGVESALYTR